MIRCSEFLRLKFRARELDPSTGFVNCLGGAMCVFRKLGWSTDSLKPSALCPTGRSIEDSAWERIGSEACSAKEDGDLILSGPLVRPHVEVLVDFHLGLAFSVLEQTGAMVRSVSEIRAVRGVYRLRKEYR